MQVPTLHLWTQVWLKSIKVCGRYAQVLTLFTDNNNNNEKKWVRVSYLLKRATQKCSSFIRRHWHQCSLVRFVSLAQFCQNFQVWQKWGSPCAKLIICGWDLAKWARKNIFFFSHIKKKKKNCESAVSRTFGIPFPLKKKVQTNMQFISKVTPCNNKIQELYQKPTLVHSNWLPQCCEDQQNCQVQGAQRGPLWGYLVTCSLHPSHTALWRNHLCLSWLQW